MLGVMFSTLWDTEEYITESDDVPLLEKKDGFSNEASLVARAQFVRRLRSATEH